MYSCTTLRPSLFCPKHRFRLIFMICCDGLSSVWCIPASPAVSCGCARPIYQRTGFHAALSQEMLAAHWTVHDAQSHRNLCGAAPGNFIWLCPSTEMQRQRWTFDSMPQQQESNKFENGSDQLIKPFYCPSFRSVITRWLSMTFALYRTAVAAFFRFHCDCLVGGQ